MELERLKLVRQTNSPDSERRLKVLSRRLRKLMLKSEKECEMNLEEAWNAYESGNREVLFACIKQGNFDPNLSIGGEISLLIKAILSGDSEIVHGVLEIPGVDVNFMGNSGFLPIELCFNNAEMFDALLSTKNINLLARDVFGFNPIEQAMKESRRDLVEKMLRRVEPRDEAERKVIEGLENELTI